MTPATEKRLRELRAGLEFASKAHRPAIQKIIDELTAPPESEQVADGGRGAGAR